MIPRLAKVTGMLLFVVITAGILGAVNELTMVGKVAAQTASGWCYNSRDDFGSVQIHCFGNRHTCETAVQADPRHIEAHCFAS